NLLMSLGILPMIGGGPVVGRGRPGNLVHVVFDNGLYGSTGNQLSPSRAVGLHRIARAARYARGAAGASADGISTAGTHALSRGGPRFLPARLPPPGPPGPRHPHP